MLYLYCVNKTLAAMYAIASVEIRPFGLKNEIYGTEL